MALSDILGKNITTAHPNSRVALALSRQGVPLTSELTRIVNLPRRKFNLSAYPDASVLYAKSACTRKGCQYCASGSPTLRPIQSAMIIEAAQNNGAFLAVGVGQGKTLASFLMHEALNAQVTVLLVPPALRDKTLAIDLPELALHFKLPNVYRAEDFKKGQPGVYVLGYSEISATDASDLLTKIQPDLIVADEVQNLRIPKSARTRRFLRFMRKNPCKFVAMTGTPVARSIMDFAHLIEFCLGKNSPLPVDWPSLSAWADAIDNEGKEGAMGIGALSMLLEDGESARSGFQRRFKDTHGVIVTEESSIDIPVEIREFMLAPDATCMASLQKLESDWAWDGVEYTGALDISRLQRQITCGYYYKEVWPNGIRDTEYLEKRNAWSRAIRQRLSHQNRVNQDSPALLEALAEAGSWTPVEWVDWLGVRDRPAPGRESVEISHWLIEHAMAWIAFMGQQNTPGIIWCSSPVIGRWLESRGVKYYGQGDDETLNADADQALRKLQSNGEKPRTVACSVQAHGTGKNLQAWSSNLVLYPMSLGAIWEQTIGRTHRPGQIADKVTVDIILASTGAIRAWAQAIEDAALIEETTSLPQKLKAAEWKESDDRLQQS
jgi:hypothetical protein